MSKIDFHEVDSAYAALAENASPEVREALESIRTGFPASAPRRTLLLSDHRPDRKKLHRLPILIIALFAVYFPAADFLMRTDIEGPPKGKAVHQILRPFQQYHHAWTVNFFDTQAWREASTIMLYENGRPLGPRSEFSDIFHIGAGRFAAPKDDQLVFSTSDNSDPNTNGRTYWLVLP